MSKKTRKKSSKSASGRVSAGAAAAKNKALARTGAKKTASQGATKSAAKSPKRTGAKTAGPLAASKSKTAAKTKPMQRKPAKSTVLTEGDAAPAFSLPRDGGQTVSLADYAGRKLVIFFYPRADTPGCTLEAAAFSRLADDFASSDTAVLGVSADPLKAQESFRDKHGLAVPLVSDEQHGMLSAYGVWGEKSMYGKTFMGIARTTVLIDGRGNILKIWRNVRVDGHADEVLTAARAA